MRTPATPFGNMNHASIREGSKLLERIALCILLLIASLTTLHTLLLRGSRRHPIPLSPPAWQEHRPHVLGHNCWRGVVA